MTEAKRGPGGKPPKFTSPEAMQAVIDVYFAQCEADERPRTVSGLALTLGMSTECLRNYGHKDEYLATVKAAKQEVERWIEERLFAVGSPVGAIFNLKNNFGWKDKSEAEITGKDGGPIQSVSRELSPEEASRLYRDMIEGR